jgi:hypothetical protein
MPEYISFDMRLNTNEEGNKGVVPISTWLVVGLNILNIGLDERGPVRSFSSRSSA